MTFTDVLAGSYDVAEVDPTPDFDGTNLVCVDPDEGHDDDAAAVGDDRSG